MLHPNVILKNSKIQGQGVFAIADLKKDEIIWQMESNTPKFHVDVIKSLPAGERADILRYAMQINEEWYIGTNDGSSTEPGDFINHSCDPNTWFIDDVTLAVRRDIKQGEEITYDYATSDTYELYLNCQCGSPNCRKVITGTDYRLHKSLQMQYGKYVMSHVLRTLVNA